MKTSLLFVAALTLGSAGCKKKGSNPEDCATAINNSMAVSKADMEKTGMDAAMMAKMTDIGMRHCKDDKWSAEAIKCMTNAPTMNAAQACYGKLSKDQQEKMNAAAMEMAAGAHPPDTAAPGSGDTGSAGSATGSDTGSAGSGSAAAAGSAAAGSGSAAAPK